MTRLPDDPGFDPTDPDTLSVPRDRMRLGALVCMLSAIAVIAAFVAVLAPMVSR